MKRQIKVKIVQEVFNYIFDGYKRNEKYFQRDEIVTEVKKGISCRSKLYDKAISREIDRQLLFFCKWGILENPTPKKKSLDGKTLTLSDSAPSVLIPNPQQPVASYDKLYSLATDINDRQYRMYAWYTTKFQNLLTVGSFLFAGIVLLISSIGSLGCKLWAIGFVISTFVSLIALAISVMVGLYNLNPTLNSKIGGNENNIRSLIGMMRFLKIQKKLAKTEDGKNFYSASSHYYDYFKTLNDDQMLKFAVLQCIGMGKNNLRSELHLKIATICMIIAFGAGILSIMFYILHI